MSIIRAVTSASVTEALSIGGRTRKEWLLQLECGHTGTTVVKYKPLPGPEGRKGQVHTRNPADALPHPKHVTCRNCPKGAPAPTPTPAEERAVDQATLTFIEHTAADTVSGSLVALAALLNHRPARADLILDYTSDGLNDAARQLADQLAGTPTAARITEQLITLRATYEKLLEACADAGHGPTPLQSAHRGDVVACQLCRTVRELWEK